MRSLRGIQRGFFLLLWRREECLEMVSLQCLQRQEAEELRREAALEEEEEG